MKTIILGWEDADGFGPVKLIAAPDVSQLEQGKIMDAADRHDFPKGIKFIAQFGLTDMSLRQAQFISDEVSKSLQDRHEKDLAAEADRRAIVRKENLRLNQVANANKALTAAAGKRNKALAAVAAQKNLLSANLPAKEKDEIVKKIATLQADVDAAIKEFDIVLELRDFIKNPKSEPEDVAAAVELIKSPAKALEAKSKSAQPPVIDPPPAQ